MVEHKQHKRQHFIKQSYLKYCEITSFWGHNILWFDDDKHLNSWIFKLNTQLQCIKLNQHFVGILNSWIVLPTKNTKFNVQQLKKDFTVNVKMG